MPRRLSHVIGFDDAPFERGHRGDVLLVGVAYSADRLEGVLSGRVRRDGINTTSTIARLVAGSHFAAHTQVILLQGIAFAGFNVVDMQELHRMLGMPVVAVSRRNPDLAAIKKALLTRVRGGARKWALIERMGPMEPVAGLFVQRAGIGLDETEQVIRRFALHGNLPEPLRTAHLIAGGIVRGESGGRP